VRVLSPCRRIKFKAYSERKNATEQINKETGKITETFKKLGVDLEKVSLLP
jgi:CRISPR/Cas system-associated exonuclease Cas4 (RecB family)